MKHRVLQGAVHGSIGAADINDISLINRRKLPAVKMMVLYFSFINYGEKCVQERRFIYLKHDETVILY